MGAAVRARGGYFAGRCGVPIFDTSHNVSRHCLNEARGNGRCRIHQPGLRPCDPQQTCALLAAFFSLLVQT